MDSSYLTRADAIAAARAIVAGLPAGTCSQITVQNTELRTEWAYGQDPYPSRG
jgi:hypothetical protein